MEKTNDNIKQLLEKIKALAINGVDGEKENAQLLLKKLMHKYKITDNDLEINKRDWRNVTLPRFRLHNKLFWAIIQSTYDITAYRKTSKRDVIKLFITQSELVEIIAKYNFYVYHFDVDIDAFAISFISKNKLFPVTERAGTPREMTEREYQRWLKAHAIETSKYNYNSGQLGKEQLQLDFEEKEELQ
ncbi:hypothetical protein [Haploplasma axanthum]|nr:hypothetical protein [Haploplasma axanthum]